MAKTNFKTIQEYHDTHPPETQERMEAIRRLIHQVVPEVEEVISYQIPCFKYQGYLLYYSAYAKHISLSYPYTKEFIAKFAEDLKSYKVSKSAIQFPHNQPFPLALIKRFVQFRKKENEANAKAKKATKK
jgi:uncharacterized protein YdhG (YjbR/CyaY superfamily)